DLAPGDHSRDAVRAHNLGKGVVVARVPAVGRSVDANVQRANRRGVRGSRPADRTASVFDLRWFIVQYGQTMSHQATPPGFRPVTVAHWPKWESTRQRL